MKPVNEIELTNDGQVKDFTVEDAHTLYVEEYDKLSLGKRIHREAEILPSLNALTMEYFKTHKSAESGRPLAQIFEVTEEVLQDLRSKGEAYLFFPRSTRYYKFYIRKSRHADELKHRG